MGYSFRLIARVLLYAPSHRQDNTYHGLCYTSRGALAGTRHSSMGPPHEGSIRRPIAPWANALTTELHLAPFLGEEWKKPREWKRHVGWIDCIHDMWWSVLPDHPRQMGRNCRVQTTQEEADTRVLLHVVHAAKTTYKAVIIMAEDWDITSI